MVNVLFYSLIREPTHCVCLHPAKFHQSQLIPKHPKIRKETSRHPPTRSELLGGGADVPLVAAGLLGQQRLVDIGHHAAGGDRHGAQQLAQLLVVPHRQLDVTRHDAVLLVVPRRVPGQLKNLVDLGKTNHEVRTSS